LIDRRAWGSSGPADFSLDPGGVRQNTEGALTEFAVLAPASAPTTIEQIVAALHVPLGIGALAKELDLNRTGAKFRNALEEAVDAALIIKARTGRIDARKPQ